MDDYLKRMKQLQESGDIEVAHIEADDILCEVLLQLGYKELVDAFNDLAKWYA